MTILTGSVASSHISSFQYVTESNYLTRGNLWFPLSVVTVPTIGIQANTEEYQISVK